MRVVWIGVVACVIAGVVAAPAWADMADDCVQDQDAYRQIEGCTAVIASGQWSGDNLAWAYNNRGNAYDDLERYERAIADYDRAILLDPDDADAYNNRGIVYRKLGQQERAIADFDEAIRLDPDHTDAYSNRGIVFRKLGQPKRAIADYDEAIRLDPDDADAYHNRGSAHLSIGRNERAIEDKLAAVRLDPSAGRWNSLAWARYVAGQYEPALSDVDKSLALDPNDEAAVDIRAHVLTALGRTDAALAEFERAAALGGTDLVKEYQEALVGHGYNVVVDGAWGPASRKALTECLAAGCRLLE